MTRLLDGNTKALCDRSREIGEGLARKLFNARGNHSEAHLSEYELALACAAAAQVAMDLDRPKVNALYRAFKECIGRDAFADFEQGNRAVIAARQLIERTP